MDKIQVKEKYKMVKRKIYFISLIITIVILAIAFLLFFIEGKINKDSKQHNSYIVSGEILTASEIYPNIVLEIEDRENGMFATVLKDNEFVSEMLLSDIRFNEIKDFSVRFDDYNNDGNKDFVYVNSKADLGYNYKFYSVDKSGNISDMGEEAVWLKLDKASVKLIKVGENYEYKVPVFYYNGYKVNAEVGEYKLSEKVNTNNTPISKNSKISVDNKYNAIPREVIKLKEFPLYIQNVNEYMKDIENKQCIEVDLDGDNKKEYIVYLVKENNTVISLFDSSANFLVSLFSSNVKKDMSEVIEIADVDNDGIMEIIVIDGETIKVNRYNNGFFY